MQDLFRHLRIHARKKKLKQEDICYIHKIAYTKVEQEEPVPFAGMVKFITYKCPMCDSPMEVVDVTNK